MPEIGEPDSDDHQLSTTVAPEAPYFRNSSWYMVTIDGSDLSPAKNNALKDLRPPLSPIRLRLLFSGSSLLMALRAADIVSGVNL